MDWLSPILMFIRSEMGDTNLDIGPGAMNWIVAFLCPGMVVGVNVGKDVGLRVGSGISVGRSVGIEAIYVSVAAILTDSAVSAITVGRYSGG